MKITKQTKYQDRGFWTNLVRLFKLGWYLFRDSEVSFTVKLIPIFALIYILSPLDFIPDMLPVIGQIDDLTIFILSLQLFVALAPREIVKKYQDDLNNKQHE